ncbi:transposase [Clostridium sp. MB05]|jgi:transposase-like protein|uniref:transposase n=1 Tax=Clostridium sp. MB05 TaxID=3376682 RepID=UPI003982429F
MSIKHKTYSTEFKINAIEEYIKTGKSQKKICEDLNITSTSAFSRWVIQYNEKGPDSFYENEKPRREAAKENKNDELTRLRAENEVLKKLLEKIRGNA